ncbi:hypothetical protein ACFL12_04885 [Pseudomonadota bacterium]
MTEMSVEDILEQYTNDPAARRSEFYRYYSDKRIAHQIKQLEMLKDVPNTRLTEIGSYLGFATALFSAAGFKVQTIDATSQAILGNITPEKHINKNILEITVDDLKGQDIIVCCETLEHLHFTDVEDILATFSASGAEWLMISVPYRCLSLDLKIIKNPFKSLFKTILKFPTKKNQDFVAHPEPHGHKWELGYKGFPLETMTETLGKAGFKVEKTDYVGTVQSVFLLAKRTS